MDPASQHEVRALVGHTGFVGSNLMRQAEFSLQFHRANLASLKGASVDSLVISGLPAEKWRINLAPEADLENMELLQSVLGTVQARQVVLISTVDVFIDSMQVDERSMPVTKGLHAYGRHRLAFEIWLRERFERCCVIRLPGLFGPGLKKNLLFDLCHGHQLDRIHPHGMFQWYPVTRLWRDIGRALELGLELVHAAPEPVQTADLVARLWPTASLASHPMPAPSYRMCSRHSQAFGGQGEFWLGAEEVFDALGAWLQTHPAAE